MGSLCSSLETSVGELEPPPVVGGEVGTVVGPGAPSRHRFASTRGRFQGELNWRTPSRYPRGTGGFLGVEMPHAGCQKCCEQGSNFPVTVKCVSAFLSNTSSWQMSEISPFPLLAVFFSVISEFSKTPGRSFPNLLQTVGGFHGC